MRYLAGSYVRDKDAVVASMLICEMVAYYKGKGINLVDVLDGIYKKYRYYYCSQKSYTFEGQSGMQKISDIMENLRKNSPKTICNSSVITVKDYLNSIEINADGSKKAIDLPKSNVLSFFCDNGCSLIARPSGTEPKIKFYISAVSDTSDGCSKMQKCIEDFTKEII